MSGSELKKYDPPGLYAAHGLYHNAVAVPEGRALVFSSGLIGADDTGAVIADPQAQIARAWRNVAAFLQGIGARTEDLVRLQVHLSDRGYVDDSKAARIDALGAHLNSAVTGAIVSLFDPDLVIEIDVIVAPHRTASKKANT